MLHYYLNELSIENPCASSKKGAQTLMEFLVKTCIGVEKLGYNSMRYYHHIGGICLATDYYIQSWQKDDTVDLELRRKYRSINNKSPFFDADDIEVLTEDVNYIYCFQNNEAKGLGLAYLKETIAVSFFTQNHWDNTQIQAEKIPPTGNIEKVFVKHAATPQHIDSIRRIFEFHIKKHGKGGKNAEHGQGIMYCETEQEAEKLLNTALPHPNRERGFCNYDIDNERFVVFYPHLQAENKYHGFHYENTRAKDPDRDLNHSTNGIPTWMQNKLKQRSVK